MITREGTLIIVRGGYSNDYEGGYSNYCKGRVF